MKKGTVNIDLNLMINWKDDKVSPTAYIKHYA